MKYYSRKFFYLIMISFLGLSFAVHAQTKEKNEKKLSGNLFTDSRTAMQSISQPTAAELNLKVEGKKSPFLAGLMSAAVPGAGEIYTGNYLKAGIFLAVEAAAITTAIIYNNKGDKQTQSFENYANQNWYVAKYAYWTLKNAKTVNPEINPDDYSGIFRNGVDWHNLGPGTDWASLRPDIDWVRLNDLESNLGEGYTHRLPYFGEQQYYELIGKYPQYSHGWDTANLSDTDYHTLTDQFLWYSGQRGEANNLYKVGSTAVVFVIVNHFLSVIDAAWSAATYNSNLAVHMKMKGVNLGNRVGFAPTVNMSYRF